LAFSLDFRSFDPDAGCWIPDGRSTTQPLNSATSGRLLNHLHEREHYLHRMRLSLPTVGVAVTFLSRFLLFSQTPDSSPNDTIRVNVTINPDESRTVYEFDPAHHKATATTTERDGTPRGKIEYNIDQAGRFSSGRVFGSDGRFRFHSFYKYDAAGRLQEETQRRNDDTLLAKIVYNYDAAGKRTGYVVFDAAGKLVGRVGAPAPSPSVPAKARKGGH
jgi:YD repeat-containing protein